MSKSNKRIIEELHHFTCEMCKKWWTIGDAPAAKKKWFCPWCGMLNEYKSNKNKNG